MTLSLLATPVSPATTSHVAATVEQGPSEPTQAFANVLQQEGQSELASPPEASGNGAAGENIEPVADAEEAVNTLVSALLGAMPALTEAIATDDAAAMESPSGDEPLPDSDASLAAASLTSALLAVVAVEPGPSASPANASGDAGMAAVDSQPLPLRGKALPAWSALLGPALGGKPDAAVSALANAANGAKASDSGVSADMSAALTDGFDSGVAGSFDNKAFQTLLRNEPLLNGLAAGARQAMDSATGSLTDAGVTALTDPSQLSGANTATAASKASAEQVPGLPLRSPTFGTLLANQVLWQAKVGNNEAAIRLDPPELGPIDVRISQVDNETHLHFTVGHGLTRDQLEQAIPRLRDLFSQGGLSLGQVQVEQGNRDTASQGNGEKTGQQAGNARGNGNSDLVPVNVRMLNGLIDDYA